MFDSVEPSGSSGISVTGALKKNQSSEDLLRDSQVIKKCTSYLALYVQSLFCVCREIIHNQLCSAMNYELGLNLHYCQCSLLDRIQ